MSGRGGNGGYPHGVQPNHTSSRNFGPNRPPNLNHQQRHMIPPNSTNIPPMNVPNVQFGSQTSNHLSYPVVHSMSQVTRYQAPNHHHHHQQQYSVQVPYFLYQTHPSHMQPIHSNPHQFAAIARASLPGPPPNPPYHVSQGMVSGTDNMFYNEPYMPQPAQAQELNSVTPAMQHITGQTLPNKGTPAPTKRVSTKAVIQDPNTNQVLSEEYLRSSLPASVKPEEKPDASSNTNATSTTPKPAPEKKVKESMNDLDVRIESDQVTISNVITPEPIDDSINSSSTNSSNTLSSKQALTESKPPKTGSDKVEEQVNDLDARVESDQLTVSGGVTPEPTEDSITSSSTTHSSNQVVIEGKQELKSVESTTQQVSPVNEEIPNSNDISSSESKDTSTEETRQSAPIDVVDHAAVMTQEESISIQNDLSKSKEISETSVKVSPSETKEENKENDKLAVEHPKLNAKGKYEYEAEFLRSLQSHPLSLKKPDLPDLDIVQQVPITQREKQSNRVNDFLPSYMAPTRNNRSLPLRIGGRNSRELRPSKPPIKIIPSPSLNQDVSLHTVENAWKPAIPTLKPTDNVDEEEKKTLELVKRFRGILNKLTPQKYDDLIRQVDALAIDTEDRLYRVLELIFDKAVDEPAFCTDYAKLCKHISTKKSDEKDKSSEKDDKTKEKQFRQLLLSRCQREFESDIYKDINIDARMEEIESMTDPEKKKIAQLELDEDKRKARKRTLGIIKFIGELYMFDMLRVVIMDSCVNSLLKTRDDESLECLCTLLRTVGAKWEQDNARRPSNNQINYCISILQETVQQRCTSSRVRFMIQDVLDMKKAGWKVRKIQAENKPKTIEQLHAEIQQEEQNKKHEIQQHINKTGDTRKIPSKQDDWNANQRNRTNAPHLLQALDNLRKMDLNTSQADTISLLPQRGLWGSGASLGAGTSAQRSQPNSDLFGRNSLNERDKNPRNSGNNSGRDSMEGGRIQSSGPSFRPFSSMEKEPLSGYPGRASIGNRMPSSIAPFGNTSDSSVKKETSSRSNSMEKSGLSDSRASSNNSNSNLVRESPKKEVTQTGSKFRGNKDLSDDKIPDKATYAVKEFMNNGLKEDAREDVLDLCTEKNVHLYVDAAINLSLDLSSHDQRLLIGDLLGYLVKEKVIKQDHFCKGLHGILVISSEMIIDIPLLWNNLAEVLVPLFCSLDNSNRKKFFTKALEPCKEDDAGGAALIMYHILNYKKNNPKSPYDCASAWVSGELEWSSFLPSKDKNLDNFFEKHRLEKPVFDLQIKLEALSNYVKKNNPSLILEYISKQFTPEEVKEAKFLRALTEAVVNKCVNQSGGANNVSYKLNHKKFADYCPILNKFHNGQKNLELEIIFTVQALVGDYVNPKGLLSDIFENLYRKASVSSQAFIDWESDKTFVKNKGAAIHMVKDFLTKLKEGGSGSDS